MYRKLRSVAVWATNSASDVADDLTQTPRSATFQAALRRHGVWPKANLNLNGGLAGALLTPMRPFGAHLLLERFFEKQRVILCDTIRTKLLDVERSVPMSMRAQVQERTTAAVEAADRSLVGAMRRARESAEYLQDKVRDGLEPFIQKKLEKSYVKALKETGRGSVDRQKEIILDEVEKNAYYIYEAATKYIEEGLYGAIEKGAVEVRRELRYISEQTEERMSVFWNGDSPDRNKVVLCQTAHGEVLQVIEVLNSLLAGLH